VAFRAPGRDREIDASRITSILHVIDKVRQEALAERAGLEHRLSDALTRSSVTIGADSDEYLTRDAEDDAAQKGFSAEIRYAEQRLKALGETIAYYEALHAFTANALQAQADLASDGRALRETLSQEAPGREPRA
jgi:hypothetical protein